MYILLTIVTKCCTASKSVNILWLCLGQKEIMLLLMKLQHNTNNVKHCRKSMSI